ncbi:MAG: hypothetical protein M1453_00365 [Acidobacteria bacterium]|nr:hypothetical protein [Acidobacteriota bacterium]MCL5286440.1 hypothetical protein [Acidobacteriota bacterium]
MAQVAVLVTYREIFRKEPERADLRKILAAYKRAEVFFQLAKLNCLLGSWKNKPAFDIDQKLTQLLLPTISNQIDQMRHGRVERIVFSRITILFLMKQACFASPDNGLTLGTPQALHALGIACLMANDLLLSLTPSPSDGTLGRLASLLPFSDYISQDHYPLEIARSQKIFDEVSQLPVLRTRTDYMNVSALFQDAMGFSHSIFAALIFGCATKFLSISVDDLRSPEAMILRSTFFQRSTVATETTDLFFRKIAISESELADKIRSSCERPGDDFTVFQRFPLIQMAPGIYTCLDPGFLVEKAGRGLYWTLFFEVSPEQRKKLPAFWGAIFEAYVNSVIGGSYKAKGRFVPGPKFANGDQAFDACLVEGHNLVACEHKSSILRADCKYGGDVGRLKAELHLKFIEGDDEGAKGLAQLKKSLLRFLNGEDIDGISSKDITRIYPTLICLDQSAVVPYMGRYFNEQFHAGFPRRTFRQIITPVFTLNVSDIEHLLGYLESFRLSDIFDSYYQKNKSILASISGSEIPLLNGAQSGRNIVKEGFSEFGRKMESNLFADTGDRSSDS